MRSLEISFASWHISDSNFELVSPGLFRPSQDGSLQQTGKLMYHWNQVTDYIPFFQLCQCKSYTFLIVPGSLLNRILLRYNLRSDSLQQVMANFLFTPTSRWRPIDVFSRKKKAIVKQFENMLDSNQFSAAFLNLTCSTGILASRPSLLLTCIYWHAT